MINDIINSPFNSDIIFSINYINDIQNTIYKSEYTLIKDSVDKRKKEFIAGRVLAKQVLKRLNIHEFPLLSNKNRSPIWPKNIIGSISHNNEYACIAITNNSKIKGIGIDVELNTEIQVSELYLILTDYERKWLSHESLESQAKKSKIIFSIKESLYKCISPIINKFVDFKQVNVHIEKHNEYKIVDIIDVPEINVSYLKIGVVEFGNQILTFVTYEY